MAWPWQRRRRIRRQLLSIDPRCFYCGRDLTAETATLDHLVPASRGGTGRRENLLLACRRCNRRKADRSIEDVACPLVAGIGIHLPRHLEKHRRKGGRR